MEQVAIASHYRDIASRYDELDGYQYEKVAEMTVKHLQLQPTDLLVDVGAGTGGITHLLVNFAISLVPRSPRRPGNETTSHYGSIHWKNFASLIFAV